MHNTIVYVYCINSIALTYLEAHSKPSQTSQIKLFANNYLRKKLHLGLGSEYASDIDS